MCRWVCVCRHTTLNKFYFTLVFSQIDIFLFKSFRYLISRPSTDHFGDPLAISKIIPLYFCHENDNRDYFLFTIQFFPHQFSYLVFIVFTEMFSKSRGYFLYVFDCVRVHRVDRGTTLIRNLKATF